MNRRPAPLPAPARRLRVSLIALIAVIGTTAAAQNPTVDEFEQNPANAQAAQAQTTSQSARGSAPGQVARSAVGEVGKRQGRGDVAAAISPIQRIDNRIENRVDSRIRNRIDRTYNASADAATRVAAASDRARKTIKRQQR